MSKHAALAYLESHRLRYIQELCDFIRFPSISVQPQHAGDVRRCAAWLAAHMRTIGLQRVQLIETHRHPLVYAEWRHAPECATVLIYGHYDVQPPDPLGEWRTPPFEPSLRGSYLYGRGASDDKGQLFAHLKALEAYMRTSGGLPVNVICLFEGEEEIGSPNLLPFINVNRQALAVDAAVVSDTSIPAPDRPAIIYGLRGALGLELELRGAHRDLHSGHFGGAIHNPIQALSELLAGLHDQNGRVAIPGFYDRVRPVCRAERETLLQRAPSDTQILRNAGVRHGWGERGHTLYERTTIRPALTINGITGGYQGPGGKGIIPARATAKLSFRLVPDQDPGEIEQLFREYIAHKIPPTMRATVRIYSAAQPALMSREHPAIRATVTAYQRGFGTVPSFLRSGGTIPVVNTIQQTLGTPTVLMGFGLASDHIHAPNERFYLPNFSHGIATAIWFLAAARAYLRPQEHADDH